MKKIFLPILFLAISISAFAQKPAKGDNTFSFGITGLSNIGVSTYTPTSSLLFKHYFSDNFAVRLGVNYYSNKTDRNLDLTHDTVNNNTTGNAEGIWKTSRIGFTLGGQYNFKATDRLETYIGADLYISINSNEYDSTYNYKNTFLNGTPATTTVTTTTYSGTTVYPKGTTIGFIPCIGLNYFFTDWLAVGAEFGWGFLSTSYAESTISGSYNNTVSTTPSGGPTTSTVTTSSISGKGPSVKVSGMQTTGRGMITVTAAFR
jgi:hypothetical protein